MRQHSVLRGCSVMLLVRLGSVELTWWTWVCSFEILEAPHVSTVQLLHLGVTGALTISMLPLLILWALWMLLKAFGHWCIRRSCYILIGSIGLLPMSSLFNPFKSYMQSDLSSTLTNKIYDIFDMCHLFLYIYNKRDKWNDELFKSSLSQVCPWQKVDCSSEN